MQQTIEEIEAIKVPEAKEVDSFRAACIKAFKATKFHDWYQKYDNLYGAQ